MMSIRIRMMEAPAFMAGLVREGVTFTATQSESDTDWINITLTGGY